MEFMQKQINYNRWFIVETNQGTEAILQDLIGKTLNPSKKELQPFIEGNEIYSVNVVDGYGARLSAPGYLDCTEWVVFETEEQAKQYLDEMYE